MNSTYVSSDSGSSEQYPYLPPPRKYGDRHPLGTTYSLDKPSKTYLIIEIVFHVVQAIVSSYALLSAISTVHFQHKQGYFSLTAWSLLFAVTISTLMAVWYCALAWQTYSTTDSMNANPEANNEQGSKIHYTEEETRIGSATWTVAEKKAFYFVFPILHRSRVWILVSLLLLALVTSTIQGFRIRKGFNCSGYTIEYRGFCETTKASVISSFMTGLLWLGWLVFWLLYSISRRNNSIKRSDARSVSKDLEKNNDEFIIGELAVEDDESFVFVEQSNPSTSQASLPSSSSTQYLEVDLSVSSGSDSSLSANNRTGSEISIEKTRDIDRSLDFETKVSLQDNQLDIDIPCPTIESNRSERCSTQIIGLKSTKSQQSVRFVSPRAISEMNLKNQGSGSFPSHSNAVHNTPGMATMGQQIADMSVKIESSKSTPAFSSHRSQIDLTRASTEPSLSRNLGRNLTLRPSRVSSSSHLYPTRSSSTLTANMTRQTRSFSVIANKAEVAGRARSFSVGRLVAPKRFHSWFGSSYSEHGGKEARNFPEIEARSFRRLDRSSTASSILSEVSLSLEDQQKLQKFIVGESPYPPPPGISPNSRKSISYFPDLEQKEKERVLNRTPHHSFSL